MKVLYDYQIFRMQRYGGISRYFTNLIRCAEGDEAVVPCYHSKNYYYNKLTGGYDHKYESMVFEQLNDAVSRFLTRRRLRKGDIQIFHPTYNNLYFIKNITNQKVVITIHDLAVERYPQRFKEHKAFIEKREKLIEAADHIIAVSNNTKNEIIDYYGVSPEKVTVVYHGLPRAFGKVKIHLRGLPENYVLYVGRRDGNKNFERFIRAFARLAAADDQLYLICVGGGTFTEEEQAALGALGIERKVQQRNLNDAVLAACYQQAAFFVFPSLYEGFGIPILEAFTMKCPVLLSDIGSFREIAGEAGHYFDPRSVDSMAAVMMWAMDEGHQTELLEKVSQGYDKVTDFTLERTYLSTQAVYERLCAPKQAKEVKNGQ